MRLIIPSFLLLLVLISTPGLWAVEPSAVKSVSSISPRTMAAEKDFKEYVKFLEEVYVTMAQNYYYPLTSKDFKKFLLVFQNKLYPELMMEHKTHNYIKWRSAAYMVEALKPAEDIFSAFIPPKPAKVFEQTALGQKVNLGVEGNFTSAGYEIFYVEPRSPAFEKGIREKDIIKEIDQMAVASLTKEKINELLNPPEGTLVKVKYFAAAAKLEKVIDIVSKEYYKQTVFMVPVDVPGVFCLRIEKFNRTTSDDMTRFMEDILKQGVSSLIIDLRGNPGGPPLAAREISAFFLSPNEEFAYFQMKNRPKSPLSVPEIPEKFRYHGDLVILVDKQSGSASELFSGILQSRGRAVLLGTNTAGQVFLKSMFPFEDESMLLLVTARGHFSDGRVFSFDGLVPDQKVVDNNIDLVKYAADYLASNQKKKKGKI